MAEAVGEGSGEGEEGKGEGKGKEGLEKVDWLEFTREWRRGYMKRTCVYCIPLLFPSPKVSR